MTAEQLIDANVDIVADTGEPHGILKPNELESACARPQNLWHYRREESVVALAVALLAGIVQNHPFEQGNKRTGLVGARNFLQNNGYDIGLSDEELGPSVMDFVNGHLAEEDLVEVLEEHLIDA
jgi:death on curing protein